MPNWNSRPVKRTVVWHGLPISVEFDTGDTKRGIGDYGEIWVNTYSVPYGEIPSSKTLADGEGVDVYLGPDSEATEVYVVHQLKRDGTFDEDKVMLNFSSEEAAIKIYRDHGPRWGFGSCEALTTDQFLNGYLVSNRNLKNSDEKCYACGKRITGTPNEVEVVGEEGEGVYWVGPDCYARIKAAGGTGGYQPPRGGPKLVARGQ